MSSIKTAELLLRCLEKFCVQHIYGVPGEENGDVMMALLDSSIKFITCRHEQNAAFMADMHGRLTGQPGVCLATLGPGATNLLTGVASANMDGVPLIAIVGQAGTDRLHKVSHQNIDLVELFSPITKWSATIREPETLPEVLCKAFKIACTAKPGAVMIELPEDIAAKTTKAKPLPHDGIQFQTGINLAHVQCALDIIKKAKHPILLAGSGATFGDAHSEINALMDKTRIYAAATFMGKGAINDKHPLSLHTVGLGIKDIAIEAFDKADVVICIGYDMVEWAPSHWNPHANKTIIHIDSTTAEVDHCYLPTVEIIGNIANTLQTINKKITSEHIQDDCNYLVKIKNKITTDLQSGSQDNNFPIKPQRIVADLRSTLSDQDIVISDVGAHKMWVARHYDCFHPKTCFIYNGFCSMGGALPAALQAKWLNPDKQIAVVIGDGGFVMSMQALVTAVRYQTPFIVLLWEDHHYGLIKWKQEIDFKKSAFTHLDNPDLILLSRAIGCNAERITAAEQLKPAIQQALQCQDKPSVIIIPVDYQENMNLTKHLGKIVSH